MNEDGEKTADAQCVNLKIEPKRRKRKNETEWTLSLCLLCWHWWFVYVVEMSNHMVTQPNQGEQMWK